MRGAIPAGGLSLDHQRWIRPKYAGFLLPITVLSRVFRGKYVEPLQRAYGANELDLAGATASLRDPAQWHAFINALFQTDWVHYAKPPLVARQRCCDTWGRFGWTATVTMPTGVEMFPAPVPTDGSIRLVRDTAPGSDVADRGSHAHQEEMLSPSAWKPASTCAGRIRSGQ